MPLKHYHLAQVNIGRTVAPLDSPVMSDFVAQLDSINALADRSPGFVWRLTEATGVQAYEDPMILINMSVWESIESLHEYAYKSAHRGPLRDRLQWFEKPAKAHMALWWIPAGHVPAVAEARDRLEFRRAWNDSPVAFSFGKSFPRPEEPSVDPVTPAVSFENRMLVATSNTPNGDCNASTHFHYRQEGARVWATYAGGPVQFGALVAAGDRDGRLDMRYHHVDGRGQFRAGRSTATPEILSDGRLRLHEEWEWTNGDLSRGSSIIEEVIA